MPLPDGFMFSSNNLQDFVECERRFQLRFMDRLVWPAVEVEPYKDYERMVEQDALFHKIVWQHLNGIPKDQITPTFENNENIVRWWNNYLHSTNEGFLKIISTQGAKRYDDITLSIPIGRFRLAARYDLLLILPGGKAMILEWMTGNAIPDRRVLEERLQTHVAPFVLTGAASNLTGGIPIHPDQIELVYWFANQPDQLQRFSYSQSRYQDDAGYLSGLITSIDKKHEPIFPLTPDEKRCLLCTYRSFCNRGVKPGQIGNWMDWLITRSTGTEIDDYDPLNEPNY